MNRKSLLSAAVVVAAVYLLLAFAGWDRYVVMRPVDRSALATLVVASPPSGFTPKPTSSNQVPASSSPYSSYKSIAHASPSSTAAYSVTWTNPKAANDSASIMLSYLPSASDAAKVQAQAQTRFLARGSFAAEKYAFAASVPVPGVPGGKGAVFTATGKATTPPVAAVVFATGRAQVLILLGQTGTSSQTGATAAGLARSEYLHLRSRLSGFRLRTSSVPLVATLVYWAVAAGIAVLAVSVPLAVRRARRMRAEARRRAARRQQQVRGSKIARRQATRRR